MFPQLRERVNTESAAFRRMSPFRRDSLEPVGDCCRAQGDVRVTTSYINGLRSPQDMLIQARSRRKVSGALYKKFRKKRAYEVARTPSLTKLEKPRRKQLKGLGGHVKQRLLSGDVANVVDSKTKPSRIMKIRTILESPANRNYVRRNIMTKGTIIETEAGKARITSRPGQDGTINAVLL